MSSSSELAGLPAPPSLLPNIPRLVSCYYTDRPDPGAPAQRVSFGTSGHRGSSLLGSFNEDHILAITQAICTYRSAQGIDGPLFLGMDTHALSEPAHATALEVLAANGVRVFISDGTAYTPTPALSRAILRHNRGGGRGQADGIGITPSHNPPEDGGFKYNPPSGGPADTDATREIAGLANALLEGGNRDVKRIPLRRALAAATTGRYDYAGLYCSELSRVLDLASVRGSGIRIGADALGGAGLAYWARIADAYDLNLDILNADPDPTFRFMSVDHDGKIRMDCSSPFAMAGLIGLRSKYDIAFGNDPDFDRHGIVTPSGGLMNPNHFLSVAVAYLFRHRPEWPARAAVGKTLVSSSMIDRVAADLGRRTVEVPVGFKWFVPGLLAGDLGFGGEESAGASFLQHDGSVWTTDKDGIVLALLAAEITAATGRDPSEHYGELTARFGKPAYRRTDAPASAGQLALLGKLTAASVRATTLAGDPVTARLTRAPGNDAPIGGLKVVTSGGWFAARPSGTEPIYKIYAESFRGEDHLAQLESEARGLVAGIFRDAGIG